MIKARGRGARRRGAAWAVLAMGRSLASWAWLGPLAATERLGTYGSDKERFHLVKVTDGLEHPWGLVFLPDGRMLVTERPGRLRIVADGSLVPEPVAGVPEVWAEGQGGLLDVALHLDFAENGLVYLSYASPSADGDDAATAVARGRLTDAPSRGRRGDLRRSAARRRRPPLRLAPRVRRRLPLRHRRRTRRYRPRPGPGRPGGQRHPPARRRTRTSGQPLREHRGARGPSSIPSATATRRA